MIRIRLHRWLLAFLWAAASTLSVHVDAQERNLAVGGSTMPAASEKRVALVIGNSAYIRGPLKNPVNDATDVARKLRALGFEVIERHNLKTSQIGRTLREFRASLSTGAVALFFYAGHGLQIKGENYLPAVDADIEGEYDVPNQSIAVRQVMDLLDDAKTRLNLAFLDACRNNPYSRSFRSGGEGLARISAPSGTLMSFATRPGSVAADGTGRNGLYTTHLLTAMDTSNQPVEIMLKRVTSAVKQASRGQQEPWMEGSIEGDFYFRRTGAQAGMPGAMPGSGQGQQEAIDQAVQEAVRLSNEQAARERAQLQASVQKLIEQALARQAAMSPGGNRPEAIAPPASSATVAALSPSATPATLHPLAFSTGKEPQPGDEWEYLAKEEIFGKQSKLVWRVKGVDASSGVLEELIVDGKPAEEWAFNSQPQFVGLPTDAGIFFGPHSTKVTQSEMFVTGVGQCAQKWACKILAQAAGKDRITVPAGTFDTIRIEGTLALKYIGYYQVGQITVWYSESDRRLVKQTVSARPSGAISGYMVSETIELQAARTRRQ